MDRLTTINELTPILENYAATIRNDFENAISNWSLNLFEESVHSVIGGLLSRQCMLGTELANNINFWTAITGPLVLRAMTELNINMAWIMADPLDRSEQFIRYGLGQAKLQLEYSRHLESIFLENKQNIDAQTLWLNSQQHEAFTDVNIGAWANKQFSDMAEEVKQEKTHLLYSATTGSAHGTWDHMIQLYLSDTSKSGIPQLPKPRVTSEYLLAGAKEVNECFLIFNSFTNQPHNSNTYDELVEAITGV